jgi:hypothetical protein
LAPARQIDAGSVKLEDAIVGGCGEEIEWGNAKDVF